MKIDQLHLFRIPRLFHFVEFSKPCLLKPPGYLQPNSRPEILPLKFYFPSQICVIAYESIISEVIRKGLF